MTEIENLNYLIKTSTFTIPPFQRDYSWQKEHVVDFWNDAWEAIEDKNKNYYFGPIVLIKVPEKPSEFKVVDGQQRITTLSILISVIRDISKQTANGQVHQFTTNYLFDDMKKEEFPRLKLNENNDCYYKDFILKDLDPESKIKIKPENQYEKILYNTYKVLFEKIKDKFSPTKNSKFSIDDSKLSDDMLNCFLKELLYTFQIFKIILDDDDEASKLFATLNERGLGLQNADLIKNYIFSRADQKNREDNYKTWQFIIETLGESGKMDKFLQHHYIAWKKNVREQNFYSELTSGIKNDKQVTEYLGSLKETSKDYSDLMSTNPYGHISTDLIELFSELQNDSAQPFLLNAIKKWGRTSDEIKQISKICLDLHFRAKTIGARSAKEIVNAFAEAADKVRNPNDKVEIDDIRKILGEIDFPDNDFITLLKTTDFSTRNAKYFLSKVETYREAKHKVKTVDRNITLEHIMPQNEDAKGWEEMKSKHAELLNKIGNLTLLASKPNSEEKDHPFEEKKKKYQVSGLDITIQLAKKNDWNETEINSRSEDLATDAPVIWKSIRIQKE